MENELDHLPREQLSQVLDLTLKLALPFELRPLLEQVLSVGLEALDADSGSVWLYEPETRRLVMHLPVVDPPITVKAGDGLVGASLASNRIVNVPSCYDDTRFNPAIDNITGYKTESSLCVPLQGSEGQLVGVLQLLNKKNGPFVRADEALAAALGAQCAVALQRARMVEIMRQRDRLEAELDAAREVQLATLPTSLPQVIGYDVAGAFLGAEETSGDLYDMVNLGDKLLVLLGDAVGHGLAPAITATQMQAMLRAVLRAGVSLTDAYIHVNNQLVEDLADNRFLTAFVGFLDPQIHELCYHSGGQGPLLHYRAADRKADWHGPSTFPLGVMDLEYMDAPLSIRLAPGDVFCVISDGLYEATNAAGEMFGEDRVEQLIHESAGYDAEHIKHQLLQQVQVFAAGSPQLDDITLLVVKRDQGQGENLDDSGD